MPEFPEVFCVIKALHGLVGQRIKKITILKEKVFSDYQGQLDNLILKDIRQVGKYILFFIDNYVLVGHLRMEGRFFINEIPAHLKKHVHVIFTFYTDTLYFYDHRQFGRFLLRTINNYLTTPPLVLVAKDPWHLRGDTLYQTLQKRKITIKEALLNQHIIAGLGNIYTDEVLFACGISPLRPANLVSSSECNLIIKNSIHILEASIKAGGSSVHTFTNNGAKGHFQDFLQIYGKGNQKCPKCGKIIKKDKVSGRGTSYCEYCQR